MRTPLKPVFFILAILFSFHSLMAQELAQLPLPASIVKCYTVENLAKERSKNPGAETDAQFETWLNRAISERKMFLQGARIQAEYTIPVVFHIIHNGEGVGANPNVSNAAILQQLYQLNKDFANESGSTYSVAQNTGVKFKLAQRDPSGVVLAEPGVNRINRNTPPGGGAAWTDYTTVNSGAGWSDTYINSTVKPASIWDPERYMNIWVIPRITAAGVSGILLGYATFPNATASGLNGLNNAETNSTAGVVIITPAVGSMTQPYGACGSAVSYGRGRTLTHEVGHFLGLRHIWGDSNCGTDYCDDTPVHRTDNAGKPTHPKANSCGTADEMFENYMDYVDDDVMNTFTQNQTDRIQAVMANCPRRKDLSGSTAGVVEPVVANGLFFANCGTALSVTETATTGTYPRYKDIKIRIETANAATGAATVTFNTGGTAVNNYHYQLTPASVTFAAGEVYKDVTLRILDNAAVEANRTVVLSYSISGTGVTAGATAQTKQINIQDDDLANVSNNRITLIDQNFDVSLTGWNILSSGGMPNLWRVSTTGDAGGTGNAAFISGTAASPYLNEYTKTTSGLAVLRSPLISPTGYTDIRVGFKYKVWGERDATTAYDYGELNYATAAAPNSFITVPAANVGPYVGLSSISTGTPEVVLSNTAVVNSSFHLGFLWENDNADGNDPAFNVDDILVTALGTQIETNVSSAHAYDLQTATTNHLRNATDNKIIASIENLSQNVNGVTASITQAGTGTSSLVTANGSYLRSNKVIQLTPVTANSSATYKATFYYTTAELAGWGTITNLKILKVKDGVNLGTTITSANAQLVTAVVVDSRSDRGYASFTGDFAGGFSQFMIVSANTTLPVSLNSFTATAEKNAIALKWTTEQEINNKGFGIERSKDGINYENIGWVDGNGNTRATQQYTFTDNFVQAGILYHYRLRQTDFDNKEKFSVIRSVKLESSQLSLVLAPNPVTSGHVSLFISGIDKNVTVKMYNIQGQLVKTWNNINAFDRQANLNVKGLNAGTYLISIQLDDKKWTEKLVIQ
jgi:zinc-dependent metalloproteinase lipoprotein